jgi:bacterioferritin-associated ferredoxin
MSIGDPLEACGFCLDAVKLKAMFKSEMYVCLCNGVTESEVQEAIEAGASTLEEVGYCTGAGTRCGSCRPVVTAMLDRAHAEEEHPCRARARLKVLTTAA